MIAMRNPAGVLTLVLDSPEDHAAFREMLRIYLALPDTYQRPSHPPFPDPVLRALYEEHFK